MTSVSDYRKQEESIDISARSQPVESTAESELLTKRGLHTVTVEDLSFDLGGLDRLVADKLDSEGFLVIPAYVLVGTDKFA